MYIKIPTNDYENIKLISNDGFFRIQGTECNGFYYVPVHVLYCQLYAYAHNDLSQYQIVDFEFPEVTDEETI